ncbi:MAG: hypothetical protein ABEJ35_05805 [Halobacteriaceae archaeon]
MDRERALTYFILALPATLIWVKAAEAVGIGLLVGAGAGTTAGTASPMPYLLRLGLVALVGALPFVVYRSVESTSG